MEKSQQEVFSKVFRKEALRIFVEDCLKDELRAGIRLLGKQGGHLWHDQPGGSEQFSEGVSGRIDPLSGDRVAYGLLREENYPAGKNAYPCLGGLETSPVFCKYSFLEYLSLVPSPKFGLPLPWEDTLEKHLEAYLKSKAQVCIDDFLQEKISGADFNPTDFNLKVDLKEDGVAVEAFYPLRFSFAGEEFFHLTTFDFFYPSGLKKFLRAAYFFPMQMDWQYVDFTYNDAVLKAEKFLASGIERRTFKADYEVLGISTASKLLDPSGDTIFTLTAPFPEVVDTPGEYEFKVARQNRPPALDYISRQECLSSSEPYDYLVVRGSTSFGELNLKLDARDPDHDTIDIAKEKITYEAGALQKEGSSPATLSLSDTAPTTSSVYASLPPEQLSALASGLYTINTRAKDFFGLEDSQDVRVMIDRPVAEGEDLALKIDLPYKVSASSGGSGGLIPYGPQTGNQYFISKEDPIFVKVVMPEESHTGEESRQTVTYTASPATSVTSSARFQEAVSSDVCFAYPSGTCSLSDYEADEIQNWLSEELGEKYSALTSASGELKADFSINYCGADEPVEQSSSINLEVKDCIPHRNSEFPFPAPYDNYRFDDFTGNFLRIEEEGVGLAATHACCNDDYSLKESTEVCFDDPLPRCHGNIAGFSNLPNKDTYILEKKAVMCDSQRGNVCNEDNAEWSLWNNELRCGTNNQASNGCSDIADKCQGELAWSIVREGSVKGICHGTMGCSDYDVGVVLVALDGAILSSENYYDFNQQVKSKVISDPTTAPTTDEEAFLAFGCSGHETKKCDSNLDLKFQGTCRAGKCCGGADNQVGC